LKAYRLTSPGTAAVRDVERPRPGPHDALLRVRAAGVCHTDVGLLRSPDARGLRLPVTLGHEIVGDVVELGSSVEGPGLGATVAVYELIGCGRCPACDRGADNLCRETAPQVPGVSFDGGMAEYVVVPARNLVDVGSLDPVVAAPLTDAGMTALHAVERGRAWLMPDAATVVIGIGGLGHMALQFLTVTSEARVTAVDVDRSRLDLAAELGAATGVLAGDSAARHIIAGNGGRKVDVVFDFVGSQRSLDLAAAVTGRGGAIIVTGSGGGCLCLTAAIGTGALPDREVTMVHTFGGTRADLKAALRLAESGRIHARVQSVPLQEAADALRELEAGRVLGRAVLVP
jgi:alcohol dehydrogenase, propanol-preferring